MQGLRTQEYPKFLKYFKMVQDEANRTGYVFFMDTGEGCSKDLERIELEHLFGWLIPREQAAEFEDLYNSWADLSEWEEFTRFAEYTINGENIEISFVDYLGCFTDDEYSDT